jgi:hypothetical protein
MSSKQIAVNAYQERNTTAQCRLNSCEQVGSSVVRRMNCSVAHQIQLSSRNALPAKICNYLLTVHRTKRHQQKYLGITSDE